MRIRRVPIKKVILGCFPVTVLAAVVWWSGLPAVPNAQVSPDATVDDVYAALSRQMGGATPDFETQVKPTLALHMTYAELQAFVDEGHHAPTPSPEPTADAVLPATQTPATQPVATTATQPVATTATAIVTVVNVVWPPCTTPAKAGLPGWINCPGTVNLKINRPTSSGFVYVVFDYPDHDSSFHGTAQVGQATGPFPVPVINTYISHCVTSFVTTVVVRDGQFGGPIIASQPITLTSTCG